MKTTIEGTPKTQPNLTFKDLQPYNFYVCVLHNGHQSNEPVYVSPTYSQNPNKQVIFIDSATQMSSEYSGYEFRPLYAGEKIVIEA